MCTPSKTLGPPTFAQRFLPPCSHRPCLPLFQRNPLSLFLSSSMDARSRFVEDDDGGRPDSHAWHPATQQPPPRSALAWQGPPPPSFPPSNLPDRPSPLRRGLSILARHPSDSQEDDLHASHSGSGPRGRTRLKKRTLTSAHIEGGGEGDGSTEAVGEESRANGKDRGKAKWKRIIGGNGPVDGWMVYCWLLTCWVPAFILRAVFGSSQPPAPSLSLEFQADHIDSCREADS